MPDSADPASIPAKGQPIADQSHGGDPAHLIALYTAERSELTALYLASVGVLAFGATVLGAAAGLIVTQETLPAWVPLVVPVPFCAIVLYHALVAALAKTRQLSTEILEDEILQLCGTETMWRSRDQILARAGGRVLNLNGGNRWFSVANLICNSVIVLTGIAFVFFSLYRGYRTGVDEVWILISIGANGALLTISTFLLVWGHLGRGLAITRTAENSPWRGDAGPANEDT